MKWEMVKLGDHFKTASGGTPSRAIPDYYNGNYCWVKSGDLNFNEIHSTDEKISIKAIENSSAKLFPAGTLLIAMYGATIGKLGILGIEAATNQAICGIFYNGKDNLKYLFYYLLYKKRDLIEIGMGGAQPNISQDIIKNLLIPLPPLPTQRAIAARLDHADALRQKDRQLLRAYDDLAQSVFVEMFGDPVKNEKGWEVNKLRDCCIKITDGTHFSPPNVSYGTPYVTAKHLKAEGLDFFSNPTFVSESDHKEIFARCRPEKGDVLYIKDGATTGIAAVNHYDFEFSMLSSLALLKPDLKKIDPYFLCSWLNHEGVKSKYLLENMSGAAIKRFTLQKINNFDILTPHLPLQTRFATILANIEQQKEIVRKQQAESEALFGRLLQEAFGG